MIFQKGVPPSSQPSSREWDVLRLFAFALIAVAAAPSGFADVSVKGRVVDETNAPVAAARVRISPDGAAEAVSTNAAGEFELKLPSFGRYVVQVVCEHFFPLNDYTVDILDGHELLIVLNHQQELFESVKVTDNPREVDLSRNHTLQSLSGTEILDVPFPDDRYLRKALRLMPGVVQDNRGGVHFAGGAENQVQYTLDGFNIGDPVTGAFDTRVSVDAVRSVESSSGYLSPDAGKGSAAAVAIQTKTGDDRFRYTATNFIPGIDMRKGLRMGAFSPRLGVAGPILRGRVWYSDNLDLQFSQLVIQELPKGQDAASTWQGSNLGRIQANLTPRNILYGSVLFNYLTASNTGLGPLDPISTTTDRRGRSWFFSVKDQMALGHGALLEAGLAEKRTLSRQIPQGDGFYDLTPLGRSGNYFVNARQNSERRQFLANLTLPPIHILGKHQVRAGVDLDSLEYQQDAHRTGYEQFDAANVLLSRTTFQGPATLRVTNSEAAWYVMDGWMLRRNLRVEYGVRDDWDRLSGRWALSPRASVSYLPWKDTRLSAGYSISRDGTSLQLFSRPFDQRTVTVNYSARGTPVGAPTVGLLYQAAIGRIGNGDYRTWTFGAERRITPRLEVNLNVMRKRGENAPTYLHSGGTFVLSNFKRDIYNSAEIGVRHRVDSRHSWSVSYVRSGTLSNAVQDINADQVRVVKNNFGRMGWDMPDRLMSAGYLPTPLKRFSMAYLLDTHEGSPFSVDKDGAVVDAVNSHRFPPYFELDFHLECRLTLRRKRLALRAGFNNITDHFNPTAVNSTMGAATYLKFYGSDGRHLVFRLRTLGRE